ncbi:MAG: neutral/alkaline non-lysosomal ceramidase N-terminal domain-containing protein [Acidobacteriota bacterium]
MRDDSLVAGSARVEISPPAGIPHAGWGAQTHQVAAGIDMPLYSTALVLGQGEKVAAIIDLDLIGFNDDQITLLRSEIASKTGIPSASIRICSTHTHSGPNYFRSELATQGLDKLRLYMADLPGRTVQVVQMAVSSRRPVRALFGEGYSPISVNRRARTPAGRVVVGRNEEGPVDHTVRVARLVATDGQTVATLLHYSCHPTLVGWQNDLITPDYPGPARAEVEKAVGGFCLFLQGASGDVGPIQGPTGNLEIYHSLGRSLGLEAASVAVRLTVADSSPKILRVVESGAPLAVYADNPVEDGQALHVAEATVDLPLRDFGDPMALEERVDELKRELCLERERADSDSLRMVHALATQATIRAELAKRYVGSRTLKWRIQAIRIGHGVLVGVPGEPFVEIGREITSASPFRHTLFSGYTNGGFGYLPTPQAYEEGGYEVETSPFAPESAQILVRATLQLLRTMAGLSDSISARKQTG